MIERLSEIRDKISFNIWFITDLPKKTVEQIIDFALIAVTAAVVLIVVVVCLFAKYRRKKNNEIASLKKQLAWEREKHEVDEDGEDEPMVELFVKGKDGTRKETVSAADVNYKWMYPKDYKPWKYNESKEDEVTK